MAALTPDNAETASAETPVSPRRFSGNDLAAGLMCIGIALLVFWGVQDLRVGSAMRMGPGYLPSAYASILLVFGLVLTALAFRPGPRAAMEAWRARPMIALAASVLVFAYALPVLGLAVTVFATVVVGGLATRESRPVEVLVSGIGLAALSHLTFIIGLGMPLVRWPVLL